MAVVRSVITGFEQMKVRLSDLGRERSFDFQPDDSARATMAKTLDFVALPEFSAMLDVSPYLDGAEVRGKWNGRVVQTCGISLEDFDTPLKGDFMVRVLPAGSPNLPEEGSEVDVDPDADDPPDVLEGDAIDLGAYVIEHLGLELDPFPRKPGAVFEPPEELVVISPFAGLRDLKS